MPKMPSTVQLKPTGDQHQTAQPPAASTQLLNRTSALFALLLLSPLLLLRALAALAQTRRLFDRWLRVGRSARQFQQLRFAGTAPLGGLAIWINLVRGDLGLVGPRALSETEAAQVPDSEWARFEVLPGLVSPYAVRRQVGIAHTNEYRIDAEYARSRSLPGDLGLLLRGLLGWLMSGSSGPRAQPECLRFFGIPMINSTMSEALAWIMDASAPGQPARQLAFVNPDCLNLSWRDPAYKAALLSADRVYPDGIGVRIGAQMLGWGLRDNVNGTDLFPLLCEAAAAAGRSLYLLGARPGVAAAAAAAMQERVPRLEIAGTRDGYFTPQQEPAVIDAINASGASILLVAFGAPRQDLWIAQHRQRLAPPLAMGVGGLFDFYSGRIRRAPLWMREIGMEWVFRLRQEPGRMWRRYIIGNPLFLYRVWRQKRQAAERQR